MATIKEVADLAGVSVATVSRFLNTPDAVKQETREKVENAIEALSYRPNYLGRTLRLMETKRILVVLNTISNQFYSRVVRGIEERAKEDGYSVLLCVTRGNEDNLKEFIKMLETREVDGMILTSREISEADILALSRSCPIVCACEPIKNKKIPLIAIDDEQAGYDAVRFLIKQGKQKIALLGAGKNFYSSTLREKGAKRALSEAGLAPFYISEEGFTYRAGIRSICNLMDEKKELPDAIFAFADSCAIGAINELSKRGYTVPDDVSVMGFDNTAISEMFIPTLTTVSQPQHTIGYQAMDMLIHQIKGQNYTKRYTVNHEIIYRDSLK